jgi:hypothetical protein
LTLALIKLQLMDCFATIKKLTVFCSTQKISTVLNELRFEGRPKNYEAKPIKVKIFKNSKRLFKDCHNVP